MLAQYRYGKIINILEEKGAVKVSMLTKLFNVSIETIRRDLENLEKEGLCKRVHGGAVLEKVNKRTTGFEVRKKECVEEKKEIANIAAGLVKEGQSVAMDASTTNLELARVLKGKFERLTILTNSLVIADELSDMSQYTIIVIGGFLKNDELSIVGRTAEDIMNNFNLDIAFISVGGISINKGITSYSFEEVGVQKKMIRVSEKAVILADSSKFCKVSLLKLCDFEEINAIITDSKLKDSYIDMYKDNGIEIISKIG